MAGYDGYGMPAVDFSVLGSLGDVYRKAQQDRALSGLGDTLTGAQPDYRQAAAKAFQANRPDIGLALLKQAAGRDAAAGTLQTLQEVYGGAPNDKPPPPPSTVVPRPGTVPAPENEPNTGFKPRTSYNQNETIVSAVPQGPGPNEGVNIAGDFGQRFAAVGPVPPVAAAPSQPVAPVAAAPRPAPAPVVPGSTPAFSPQVMKLVAALANPDLPDATRQSVQLVLQRLLPEDNKIMTTPDGTILAVNARTNQVTPLYQTPEKPTFTGLGNDPNTGEEVKGFVDPRARTVQPYNLPGSGSLPNPFSPGGKVTEGQSKDAGFATRMFNAEKVLRDPKVEGAATNLYQSTAGRAPGFAANYLTSPDYQKFDQAKRNFVNAVLRRESGAAISQSEFDNAEKQYFPQPGDTPEKLAEKRRNRQDAIAGVASGGGPRYRPPFTFGPNGELVPSDKPQPGFAAPNSDSGGVVDWRTYFGGK